MKYYYTLFAVLAVFACTSNCFVLDPLAENVGDERMINGTAAVLAQFPYAASVRKQGRVGNSTATAWRHGCAGTIISNRWVITAAFCTHRSNPSTLRVVVGAIRFSTGGTELRVERVVNHPRFDLKDFRNDLALLRTSAAIRFTTDVKPSPILNRNIGGDVRVLTVGWAWPSVPQNPENFPNPTLLQFGTLQTITNDGCRRTNQNLVNEGTLCAIASRSPICYDSGAPMTYQGQLIGVVTWGNRCETGWLAPIGFTRITQFVNWIQEVSGVAPV